MGVTFDKLLGEPLLHKHKSSDIGDISSYYLKKDGSNADENINIGSQDLTTTGDITAGNLSGTNTGDQDLSSYETTTQLNTRDTNNRARANHTGTQTAATISDFDTEVSNNSDVSANTTARHTHTNKILLDTYTQTEANLADAVAKKHDAATAGAGISISGQEITNSDRGSTAVGTHESTYTHTDIALNTSARHDAVTIGTNTASALSLSGQQLSIGDVFLRNSGGDNMDGNLTITGTTTIQNNLYNTSGGVYGSGSFDDKKMASVGYVKSKGMNLVVNGSGFLQNNYNFSSTTFDQTELYAGFGSFKSTARTAVTTNEYIPVDPNLYYVGSAWLKTTSLDTNNKGYGGIECSDVDGLLIAPYYTMRVAGSTPTTLASDLNNGDTTMELTDATGWYTGGTAYSRQALFFGYQNSFGYTYPDYTYSRNSTYNTAYTSPVNYRTTGFWSTTGISGNTVTLTAPWPGPTIPAGTAVQNCSSGGTYKYSFGLNVTIPEDWTQLTGVIGTIDDTGLNQDYRFHPGTAFIRLIFLTNYPNEDDNEMNISSIYFSEITPENSIKEIEYTSSATLAINEPYTHFRFNSASPISMGLNIPQTPKKEIFLRNVGTANVTLAGTAAKANTVPSTLAPGEKISAVWNYENQQWE